MVSAPAESRLISFESLAGDELGWQFAQMPGWSPEIANAFIAIGACHRRYFNQIQLQDLVYIAHGWCLALHGQPLTGDRPEAFRYGPEYRRLADALADKGLGTIRDQIAVSRVYGSLLHSNPNAPAVAHSTHTERELVEKVFREYGHLPSTTLASVTRAPGSPWAKIFADGAGSGRDIGHGLIRAQFLNIVERMGN